MVSVVRVDSPVTLSSNGDGEWAKFALYSDMIVKELIDLLHAVFPSLRSKNIIGMLPTQANSQYAYTVLSLTEVIQNIQSLGDTLKIVLEGESISYEYTSDKINSNVIRAISPEQISSIISQSGNSLVVVQFLQKG